MEFKVRIPNEIICELTIKSDGTTITTDMASCIDGKWVVPIPEIEELITMVLHLHRFGKREDIDLAKLICDNILNNQERKQLMEYLKEEE